MRWLFSPEENLEAYELARVVQSAPPESFKRREFRNTQYGQREYGLVAGPAGDIAVELPPQVPPIPEPQATMADRSPELQSEPETRDNLPEGWSLTGIDPNRTDPPFGESVVDLTRGVHRGLVGFGHSTYLFGAEFADTIKNRMYQWAAFTKAAELGIAGRSEEAAELLRGMGPDDTFIEDNARQAFDWMTENLLPEGYKRSVGVPGGPLPGEPGGPDAYNTWFGPLSEGITQFAGGAIPAARLVRFLGVPNAVLRGFIWGGIADSVGMAEDQETMLEPMTAAIMEMSSEELKPFAEHLAAMVQKHSGDSAMSKRAVNLAEGIILGAVAETVVYGVKAGVRAAPPVTQAIAGTLAALALAISRKVPFDQMPDLAGRFMRDTSGSVPARGIGDNVPPEMMDQDDLGFYSALHRGVEGLQQEKFTASQLRNQIRNLPGIKPDEIYWTGLDEFLEGNKKVTKQEVLAFLDQNRVRLTETKRTDVAANEMEWLDEEVIDDSAEWQHTVEDMEYTFNQEGVVDSYDFDEIARAMSKANPDRYPEDLPFGAAPDWMTDLKNKIHASVGQEGRFENLDGTVLADFDEAMEAVARERYMADPYQRVLPKDINTFPYEIVGNDEVGWMIKHQGEFLEESLDRPGQAGPRQMISESSLTEARVRAQLHAEEEGYIGEVGGEELMWTDESLNVPGGTAQVELELELKEIPRGRKLAPELTDDQTQRAIDLDDLYRHRIEVANKLLADDEWLESKGATGVFASILKISPDEGMPRSSYTRQHRITRSLARRRVSEENYHGDDGDVLKIEALHEADQTIKSTDPGKYMDDAALEDLMDLDHQLEGSERIFPFEGEHFPEENVVVHVRGNTRIIKGLKYFFVEEIQSDWSKAGATGGWMRSMTEAEQARLQELRDVQEIENYRANAAEADWKILPSSPGYPEAQMPKPPPGSAEPDFKPLSMAEKKELRRLVEQERASSEFERPPTGIYRTAEGERVHDAPGRDLTLPTGSRFIAYEPTNPYHGSVGSPVAPYVEDVNRYTELAVRRILRYAAENGFDGVAWTPGAVQAKRYNLTQVAKKIEVILETPRPGRGQTYELVVDRADGGGWHKAKSDLTEQDLRDHIGEDMTSLALDQIEQKIPTRDHITMLAYAHSATKELPTVLNDEKKLKALMEKYDYSASRLERDRVVMEQMHPGFLDARARNLGEGRDLYYLVEGGEQKAAATDAAFSNMAVDSVEKLAAKYVRKSALLDTPDLEIGGAYRKKQYDEIIPRAFQGAARKFNKKVKLETVNIPTGSPEGAPSFLRARSITITPEMRESLLSKGVPLFSAAPVIPAIAAQQAVQQDQPAAP